MLNLFRRNGKKRHVAECEIRYLKFHFHAGTRASHNGPIELHERCFCLYLSVAGHANGQQPPSSQRNERDVRAVDSLRKQEVLIQPHHHLHRRRETFETAAAVASGLRERPTFLRSNTLPAHIIGITRGFLRTLCGRSLTQKVTFPVGGAAEGSGVTSYMENRGSWRVISNTWNWVLACGSDTRDRVQTDVEQKK